MLRSWLEYCPWYYMTALAPTVGIEEFFEAPVVNRSWRTDRTDPQLVHFGLMCFEIDMLSQLCE